MMRNMGFVNFLATLVLSYQFTDEILIRIRPGKTEFLFERIFDNLDISVFTKYEGKYDPVVCGPCLSVLACEAHECLVAEFGYVGWRPFERRTSTCECCGFVLY